MTATTESYPVAPNSLYMWRGFKSTAISYDQFVQFLGGIFVPACALLQPPVGLRAYLPSMMPQANKPDAVPDQTALLFWATPESHDLANESIAVRIYQNLHGDVYDMTRSKLPEVPVGIATASGALQAEQPYFLLDQAADWMLGTATHFVGARRSDLQASDFLAAAYAWASSFHDAPPDGIEGALLCCGDDYVAAWLLSNDPNPPTSSSIDELAALTSPVLRQQLRPMQLSAGLWDNWPGLDLNANPCLNIQFDRPPTSDAKPRMLRST